MYNLGNNWWFFLILTTWDLVWKGIALWKSARHNQRYWFIALIVINSIGILPIVYILFFQKKIIKEVKYGTGKKTIFE